MKIPRPRLSRPEWVSLVCFLLTLFVVLGFVAWASYQIKDLRFILTEQASVRKPRDGRDGNDGLDGTVTTITKTLPGMPGNNGTNGTNGSNASDEQVSKAVDDYFTKNPVQSGKDGQDGKNGLTVFIRINPLTQIEECKILGDLMWQPIAECES